jgi:hypothetical protein
VARAQSAIAVVDQILLESDAMVPAGRAGDAREGEMAAPEIDDDPAFERQLLYPVDQGSALGQVPHDRGLVAVAVDHAHLAIG